VASLLGQVGVISKMRRSRQDEDAIYGSHFDQLSYPHLVQGLSFSKMRQSRPLGVC